MSLIPYFWIIGVVHFCPIRRQLLVQCNQHLRSFLIHWLPPINGIHLLCIGSQGVFHPHRQHLVHQQYLRLQRSIFSISFCHELDELDELFSLLLREIRVIRGKESTHLPSTAIELMLSLDVGVPGNWQRPITRRSLEPGLPAGPSPTSVASLF